MNKLITWVLFICLCTSIIFAATAINKQTLEYRKSISSPAYKSINWIINPKLPNCEKKYWKIYGDRVLEMTLLEKTVKDNSLLAQAKINKMGSLRDVALIELANQYISTDSRLKKLKDEIAAATNIEDLNKIIIN